jgi:hypothetical protein
MSCNYILDGNKFSENQLEKIINGNLSLPSIKTESGVQAAERLKRETSGRFVNPDLFTDYQEKAYIRQITAEVVNLLGIMKPGQEIAMSPDNAFKQVKELFGNGKAEVDYLQKIINTQEKLDEYKSKEEVVKRFPILTIINNVDQFNDIINQYDNVLSHFDKFIEQVKIDLRKYGITIRENKIFQNDEQDTEEVLKNLAEQDTEDSVELSDREISESFEDGRSFQMNPRDTASTRVKVFVYNIPDVTRNQFGIREFADPDMVMEDLLRVGSELENVTYESLVAALQNKYTSRPYLKNLVAKLAQIKQENNNQLLNEILTFVNKAYQEQITNLWTDKDGGISTKIIKSNRNSVIRQITRDWLEQQKYSQITVKSDAGELMINTAKVKELKESFEQARKGTVDDKKSWIKTFMNTIGIGDFTDAMIDDLIIRAGNKFFQKESRNSSFDKMFEDNNFFSNVLETYLKIPTGTTESKYDDINNGMKDESFAFGKLAQIYHDHNPNKYQTGNSTNAENKSIYAYIQKSYLENIKKKISSDVTYLDRILNRSFSRNSEIAKNLRANLASNVTDFQFSIDYMDGLRKDKRNSDGVVRKNMSTKEQLFDAIQKHQNEGQRVGYYNMFTLSDKTQTPTISLQKYILNDTKKNRAGKDIVFTNTPGANFVDSFNFKQDFKNQLYNLAESEINRIIDYVNLPDQSVVDIKNFDKAFKFFYLFPILNSSANEDLNKVKQKLFTKGSEITEADKDIIKEVLTNSFKKSVENTFYKWQDNEVIVPQVDDNGEVVNLTFPLFNSAYLASKEVSGLTPFQKAIYAIADMKFNHLRAQVNTLQLLGADPSNYYKFPKAGADKNKNFDEYTDVEKLNIVLSTMDEFSKRAAMFIAPGSQGIWKWRNSKGEVVDKQFFNSITLKDFKRDTELFEGVDVTDAQEFITLQEHIDRLMAEGKIPDDIWNSITNKINKSKGQYYELSPKEKELVIQPTKPVYTHSTDVLSFSRIDYIKSSTYVMIPEVIAGTQLDGLRKWMEEKDIHSAHFESTKKVGQSKTTAQAFDENGNFITPVKYTVQNLSREGLHTQQEIPYQKDHITNVSQMNRTLFDGLLKVKNFILPSLAERLFTGKQFKDLKENVRIAQFEKAKEHTIKRLGITVTDRGYVINNQKLVDMLREEALKPSSGFSVNDINAIKLDSNGEFIIPIYLMPRAEKFEGVLNSIINKNVMLKNPGTSLVQVSSVGTNKVNFSDLSDTVKSEIIWTENFDESKGLQYLRKSKGEVLPAQVIMSQFIKDENGELIDLSNFVDEVNGKKILDLNRIPVSILQLVGSRIPNQSHPSMLPIEIVGFLPSYLESTVIVPDGITAQMGSDFDVDKLYAYTSNLKFRRNKEGQITSISTLPYNIEDYNDTHNSLSHLSDEQLEQLYRDIHWSVLTHPSTFEKITKSIDFNDVKDEVKLLDSIGLYSTNMDLIPFDFENQIQVFNDNKGGKTGVAIFANLGSFLADNQDKDIYLGNVVDLDGVKSIEINPVKIKSKDGRILDLYKITQQGQVGKGAAARTKGDNNNIVMSESVDNAKNKNMYRFNWHPKVLNAVSAFISLSTVEGEIHDITFATRLFPQQILQEYVNLVENGQDSLSSVQGDIKEIVTEKLVRSYVGKLSENGFQKYTESVERFVKEGIDPSEVFSADRLLELLKIYVRVKSNDSTLTQEELDNYYMAQLDVLNLYNRLDEIGSELSTIMSASYIYTKGIGRNLFAVTDNLRKLSKLADSDVFIGLEQIAGTINTEGPEITIEPVGEIGYSIRDSLFFARDLYKVMFPVQFGTWFQKVVDSILTNRGEDKRKIGSERYIKLHKKIFNGVRSFMFSDPSLEIFENITEERQRLLLDSADNKSLATRIVEARVKYPELLDNYFVKRLVTRVATRSGEPSLVKYSNSFSADIDELANNRGFLALVFSGNEELQEIAKDLLRYTYVTGNNENSGSFAKYIPIEYTLSDPEFVKALSKIREVLSNNGSNFVRQFIQNNPNMTKVLDNKQFNSLTRKSANREKLSIPKDSDVYDKLLVRTTREEAKATQLSKKLPDYLTYFDYQNNQTYLYSRIGDASSVQYERINTLGTDKSGFEEYNSIAENPVSIVFGNLTNAQKLDKVLKNKDNVFNGSDINLTARLREVAMADVSTKFIGKNVPGGVSNKTYIDIVADVWKNSGRNDTDYTSDDTVMVIGTGGYELKPNNDYISLDEIQVHFDKVYKPYIDKAIDNGAKFTVGNYSGMDQVVKKYLKSNGYIETPTGLDYSIFTTIEIEPDFSEFPDLEPDGFELPDDVLAQLGESNLDLDIDPNVFNNLPDVDSNNNDSVDTQPEVTSEPEQFPTTLDFADVPTDINPMEFLDPIDLGNSEEEIDIQDVMKEDDSTPPWETSVNVVNVLLPTNEANDNNTIASVLDNIYNNTKNEFYKNIIDIFRSRKAGIPVGEIIIDDLIEDPGIFTGGNIYINPNLALNDNENLSEFENLENVLMHEVIHAYTSSTIRDYQTNKSNLIQQELVFVKSLDNLFKYTGETLLNDPVHGEKLREVMNKLSSGSEDIVLSSKDKSMYYGLTSLHEFASMLLTDVDFQQFMNTLPYDIKNNLSIFEKFKELLAKLFESLSKALGIQVEEKSVLSQGITNVISLINSSELPDYTVEDVFTTPVVFDPYKIQTPRGIFDVNEEQKEAINKISDFFSKSVTPNFDDNIFLLYGAGGTGKTAVTANAIKKAIQDNKGRRPTVGFTAVTHTAKGELISAGNETAKTLASMLGSLPKFENGIETFELVPLEEYREKGMPLPDIFYVDWLVIDEASMLGTREKEMIQQRITERGSPIKILFMGDHSQIPPVGEKPDQDGFAINLRKNSDKSTQLIKVERTKNVDIADLGMNYRRAVDFYNTKIEETGTSRNSGLATGDIVTVDKRVSSENIKYTNSSKEFVDDFIEVFKKDPLNPRNAIIIAYNNENHPDIIKTTSYIRKTLFGDITDEELFVPGEPISIKSTITVKTEKGRNIELGTNERLFIKDITAKKKTYNVGSKYKARNIQAPVYEITAYDKNGNVVKFDSLDKAFASQLTSENYDKAVKGYRLSDGSIFKYADKMDLQRVGLTDIYHSYMVSSHKVQGQTYNHAFVAERNVVKYVGTPDGKGGVILTPKSYSQIVYTAISRAREKVYILSERVSDQEGNFKNPIVEPMKLKSVSTISPIEINNDYIILNQCN